MLSRIPWYYLNTKSYSLIGWAAFTMRTKIHSTSRTVAYLSRWTPAEHWVSFFRIENSKAIPMFLETCRKFLIQRHKYLWRQVMREAAWLSLFLTVYQWRVRVFQYYSLVIGNWGDINDEWPFSVIAQAKPSTTHPFLFSVMTTSTYEPATALSTKKDQLGKVVPWTTSTQSHKIEGGG